MGGVFWPALALIGLLCLLSIRAQLRRLVRRFDLTIQVVDRILSARPDPPAFTPRGTRT